MNQTHLLLHQHLGHSAAGRPDKLAVRDVNTELTYAALHDIAQKGAAGLHKLGVSAGDRVLLYMDNSVDFAIAFWSVVYAGAVVTPISPDIRQTKLTYIIKDCDPAAIITDLAYVDVIGSALGDVPTPVVTDAGCWAENKPASISDCGASQIIDQDLGCIIYTSGSTGSPKGVMLSQQNLVSASRSVAEYLGYTAQDSIFVAIPLTFDYGMHQLTMAALVGATVVIERNFAKPLFSLDRLSKSGATAFPLVPTMVPLMSKLASRFDLGAVRLVSSTAAALDPKHIDQIQACLPQATVFSMYGLTECHRCTYVPPNRLEEKKTSVGIAIPNTQLWVVDRAGKAHRKNAEGELVIRGATVMKGYWNSPTRTAERLHPGPFPGEFVFHTGDICRLDEDGFVYFIGRQDDVLKIKGEKVAPKEVEDILRKHASVSEAIVYGRAAKDGGHTVCAAVTLIDGAQTKPDALRDWCAQHLEAVAVPRVVDVIGAFKLTANGKIDRNQFKISSEVPPLTKQPSIS
ncbi:MAG: AMP-binding protein [Aliishimia sp.]